MSKHVSPRSPLSISITAFYCVDGEEIAIYGPAIRRGKSMPSYAKFKNLAHTSYMDLDVALSNLQYLLRLDAILKEIDTRTRVDPKDVMSPGCHIDPDHSIDLLLFSRAASVHAYLDGRRRADYLGKRPYACCSQVSSGGLARGKSQCF